MKNPDEIKKAIECCFYDSEQCGECPYYPVSCDRELVRDAREYIRQLEAEVKKYEEGYDALTKIVKRLEAERDAAGEVIKKFLRRDALRGVHKEG